jgi:gliding motility-associated-like protein
MRRCYLFILLIISSFPAIAQYADTGQGKLKEHIWWFDWNGFTLTNGASKTFNTRDGLTITITFSAVSGPQPLPSVMNTWGGAVLHFLFDFTNPLIEPALLVQNQTQNSAFTMKVDVTRNGLPTPFTFCAADAEASVIEEQTTFITTGGNWKTIQFYRNSNKISNPVTGCGTQTIVVTDTYHSNASNAAIPIGQNPLMATDAPSTGTLSVEVHMDKTLRGGMAVAFGILTPADRGDLPASYGYAAHAISYTAMNSCNYDTPLPDIMQDDRLKLGAVLPDADNVNDVDDNTVGVDEDAITVFPDYDRSGSYTINVPLTNTTGVPAYLSGWFDFNRNQQFDANEFASVTVPPVATTARLTWTGIPDKPVTGNTLYFGFRFRLSSSPMPNATGIADNGEVEDYLVRLKWSCDPLIVNRTNINICAGKTFQLEATGYPYYKWYPSDSLSAVNIPNPVANPTLTTTYTVTGTDGDCTASVDVNINVNPIPRLKMSVDTMICSGDTTQISATADIPVTYRWLPEETMTNPYIANPGAFPIVATRYVATATSNTGCISQDSILVIMYYINISVTAHPSQICKGDTTVLRASGGNVFEWLDVNNTVLGNRKELVVKPAETTTYKVIIKDSFCDDSQTLTTPVFVKPSPVSHITYASPVDCTHPETRLTASGGVSYVWKAANGIENLNVSDPLVKPTVPTTYHVLVKSMNGCETHDSIAVPVDLTTALSSFPMASAFSPNGDGKNDCLGFKYWGASAVDFNIYNRWGELVFHSTSLNACWDGTFKGQPQPVGTYVYAIRAKTLCGEGERKGTVVLIR